MPQEMPRRSLPPAVHLLARSLHCAATAALLVASATPALRQSTAGLMRRGSTRSLYCGGGCLGGRGRIICEYTTCRPAPKRPQGPSAISQRRRPRRANNLFVVNK